MGRRDKLFGVRVSADFRDGVPGKRALREFRLVTVSVFLGGLIALITISTENLRAIVLTLTPVMIATFAFCFFWQREKLKSYAVQATDDAVREISFTTEPDHLPSTTWLAIGPYILLAAVAWWLHAHWTAIPDHFPVHFDINGNPNSWKDKTFQSVYGDLMAAAAMATLFLGIGAAGWYGSRRGGSRSLLATSMIGTAYMITIIFSMIALWPIMRFPVWVIVVTPITLLVPMLMYLSDGMTHSGPDTTPNEGWKLGVFYFNRNDPALFVEKRFGIGWTLNLAHPASWVITIATLLTPFLVKLLR